jgi:hypothetical protein
MRGKQIHFVLADFVPLGRENRATGQVMIAEGKKNLKKEE